MKGHGVARRVLVPAILLWLVAATTIATLAVAAGAEETLVARLPLSLEGDVDATAERASLLLSGDEDGVPRLDMMLSSPKARVGVTNFTRTEVAPGTAGGMIPSDLQGETDMRWVDDAEFRIGTLGEAGIVLAYDGTRHGARYEATPATQAASLDLITEDLQTSYTQTPDGLLDFDHVVPGGSFVVHADDVAYTITGDFTLFVFDAPVTVLAPNGTDVHETGMWHSTTRAGAGPAPGPIVERSTTVQYVRIELYDATFTLHASGGHQALMAGPEDLQVDVMGALSASAAAGSLQVGDENIRSTGDRVRAEGTFQLVPTYVVDPTTKHVVFAMRGTFESLSVGAIAYTATGAVAAATGLALVLAAVGAYFWETVRTVLFLPLYAKLTKDKVLDQDTRSAVHEKIEQDPGCQVNDLAAALDVSWTTAAYHVRVLRKMGLVVAKNKGRRAHLFVTGSPQAAAFEVSATLKNDTARQIVELVLRHPGIIQKEICDRLKIAPSTASWHLARLKDADAISQVKDWKMRRYFAGSALEGVSLSFGTALPPAVAASA